MGNEHAKPINKLKFIDREVNSLRSSIRSARKNIPNETKDEYIQMLARFSNEAGDLKGKVKQKYVEQTQKNISNVVNEILTKVSIPRETDLDSGAVETSSFVQLPINKRQASNKGTSEKPPKKQKSSQVDSVKGNSTLLDIEEKLKTLKPQINIALENKDTTLLRVHQQTIRVLATDLELIDVSEDTPIGDKKKKLESKEAESLLKLSLRNNDSSTIQSIQEKLVSINQKLSPIEVTDESTKTIKMQQMDKIKWFYRYINDTSKNSSQSDLSKAHIKEDDENTLKRKQQLLNNVRQSFSFILEDENKERTNTGSIPKKPNTSYKEIDNFYNVWKSIQKIVKSSTYSAEEVAKIDKILEDIQNSIGQTRQQIAGNRGASSNLKTKLNYSTPNLSSSKVRPKLEGSLSLDHTGQNLIKTKAKVYNLSTPEIRDISDQPVVLRNKQFYKNFEFEDGYRFSKIEEIKTQVNYIKEKFAESQQKQHLKNKLESYVEILEGYVHHQNQATANNAKIVLTDIQKMLKNMSHVQEAMNATAQRRMSIEDSFENIAGITEAVDMIEKAIDAFSGKIGDEEYTKIKNGLLECRNCLKETKVPAKYDMIQQQKEQILKKIDIFFDTLESKNTNYDEDNHVAGIQETVNKLQNAIVMFSGKKNDKEYTKIKNSLLECRKCLEETIVPTKHETLQKQKEHILKTIPHLYATLESKCQEDPVVVITRRNLSNLKEKVRRFSGAYKGVLYNKIEKDLNKLLIDVGETIGDKETVDDLVKDVEKHLKILEHRATKDQSFRRTISETAKHEEDQLVKLKSDLMNIKAAIDTTPTNGVNLFVGLKSRLDLVKLGLDQLKFSSEDDEKQKEILYNEVDTFKNLVEAKIGLGKQAIRQWPFEQDKNKRYEEEMNRIEEKFKILKPEIENFVGTTSDNKFYELDESSIRLVLKMDKLQFARGTAIHNRKINLLKEIYTYGDLLDQRAKETEDIIEIESEIHDLEKNFERYLRLNDLQNLQDKLNKLATKINDSQLNKNLLDRKQNCVTKMKSLLDKLRVNEEVVVRVNTRRSSKDPANEFSKIEMQFGDIKKEIEAFVGIHADRKYYELDGSLSGLFAKLDNFQLPEQSELHSRKIRLLKEMQTYSDLLDKRAKETETIREISKKLNAINIKVDSYRGADEDLRVMESDLKSVQSKLEKIKISELPKKSLEQKYDILFGEYNRFTKAKEVPKNNYIGSASFLADVHNLNNSKTSLNKQDPIETDVSDNQRENSIETQISEIQKEIDEVKSQVAVFINSDTSDQYKKLEECLLLLNLRVNKLEIPKNNELYQRKVDLDKDIQDCFMILDERAQEADGLMDIEKELAEISNKFDCIMSEEEKNSIDEKLISLQVKLGKLHVNDDLSQRKNMCTNKIIIYSKQLKDIPFSKMHSNLEEKH
ncbi:hypothetical protein NQ314_000403 [Rhamnusium bicolor]|uniref:Uncharacterized protein n=1 Tax=Rhamnusium bicolor TaxID=1586634 RepID=A0AAV8ZU45_9CUCU|nr:hypothetical protein NQ314_000403 [Rhamnusium bicolor]